MKNPLWIVLTLLAALGVKFILPTNPMDTGWDFGHAYSILRGTNGLFYNDYLQDNPTYWYGFLIAPLAAVSSNTYTPKIFYSFLLITLTIILIARRKKGHLNTGIIILLMANYLILTHRPEVFSTIIGIFAFPFLFTNKKINWPIALPVGLFLFLVHPANAVILAAALLASNCLLMQRNKLYLLLYVVAISVLLAIILVPTPIFHFTLLKNRIVAGNQFAHFVHFLKYGGLTLVALAVIKRKIWTKLFALNYLVLFLFTFLFSPHYYYTFLFVPFLVCSPLTLGNLSKFSLVTAISFNILISIVNPIYVHLEHPKYAKQATQIINYIDKNTHQATHTIFIDQHIGFPLYAKSANAKMMMLRDTSHFSLATKPLPGDVAYLTNTKDIQIFKSLLKKFNPTCTALPTKVINPVHGRLSLHSLYTNRTDSLGLYKITIYENEK